MKAVVKYNYVVTFFYSYQVIVGCICVINVSALCAGRLGEAWSTK